MARRLVLAERQHRVGLGKPRERAGKPHLVALMRGRDDPGQGRRAALRPGRRLDSLLRGEDMPGIELVRFHRDADLAGRQMVVAGLAAQFREPAEPGARERRALLQPRPQRAQHDAFSQMLAILRMKTHRQRIRDAEPFLQRRDVGHLVPQRLHQAENAVPAVRRAEEGRQDVTVLRLPPGDLEKRAGRRLVIFDQFFQKRVVIVRHVLQKLRPRLVLALGLALRHRDKLRGLALAVAPGAFGDEVDGADDLPALADRDLAQDDGVTGIGLQRGDDVAHPSLRNVHAVNEDEAGHARRLDRPEPGRSQHRLVRVWRDTEHGGIGRQKRRAAHAGELRPRHVQSAPVLAHEPEARQRQMTGRLGPGMAVLERGKRADKLRFPRLRRPQYREAAHGNSPPARSRTP